MIRQMVEIGTSIILTLLAEESSLSELILN